MNITPQAYNAPIATAVNLQTDSLRRDNQQREVITKPEALSQSASEKGVASDKDRGRTPAQNNEQIDFTHLRKQAEQANESINGGQSENQNSEKNSQREDTQQDTQHSSNENHDQNSSEALAEKQLIQRLESRDKEVRTHEMAHAATGGALAGSPSYTFEVGPNGKKYAVEGEVSIDLTPVAGDPKETIAKMKKVQAAALAPASPSAQDARVAASASSIIAEAQAELVSLNDSDDDKKSNTGNLYRDKKVLQDDESFASNEASSEFDRQIQRTLSLQEAVVPSRNSSIDERAERIERFYQTINHAYEKPSNHQFEIMA